jgi:hypothetical protein
MMKKCSVLTMIQCLILLGGIFISTEAHAKTVIFAAVYGGTEPGIWRIEDKNADGDALDESEAYLFARLPGTEAIDVSIDKDGVLYAIGENKNSVYRIEDKNSDGDALDVGEVTVFRDLKGLGLTLEGPLSIGVANEWDVDAKQSRTVLYVMDLALQLLIRLTDRNGDGDAQESDEICIVLRNTTETPFTANRLIVDRLGKVIACNPNNRTLVLLDNLNNDCFINPPLKEIPCPSVPAGCVRLHQEYQALYKPGSSKTLLRDPYGIDLDSKGNFYVSEHTYQEYRVVKLTDNNGDGDISDIDEAIPYYDAGDSLKGFDIVVDPYDMVFLGQETSEGTVLTRLEDLNGDGDARDAGEAVTFADFKGGLPLGLAVVMPEPRVLEIIPQLVDVSPLKGPLLVVKNGENVELSLRIIQSDTGLPLSGAQVGYQVMAGCLALCPLESRTNSDGYIKFRISRLASSPEGGEELRFWTYGHEVIIPVVATACSPDPLSVAGPDLVVSFSQTVVLNGSASSGAGLHYCWIQTGGPSVGLPICDETTVDNPSVSFTAPGIPATLQFELNIRNACDVFSKDAVTVSVAAGSLAASSAGSGLWIYNSGSATWTKVSPANPENMTYSGSTLYGDFGTSGLWKWSGTAWSQLTTANPEYMAASYPNLYADFGAFGLWQWDGTAWIQRTTANPEYMACSISWLYADFGSFGLWELSGTSWSQLTTANPEYMVASYPNLYVDFGGFGLWKWDKTTTVWSQLTTANPSNMVTSGSTLYGDFGALGLWKWNGTAWSQLTGANPENIVASGLSLYGDFGTLGLWKWNGTAWSQLTGANPENIVVSGLSLYGDFGTLGIWKWDGSNWSQLSGSNPDKMAAN